MTIPAGTSFSTEDTVTNANGVVTGLAKVSPNIVVVPDNSNIVVDETVSEQKFTASYSNLVGKYVEIDCEDRILWVRDSEDAEPVNITGSVDIDSDWFTIDDVYRFKGTGCIIQSVTYNERG